MNSEATSSGNAPVAGKASGAEAGGASGAGSGKDAASGGRAVRSLRDAVRLLSDILARAGLGLLAGGALLGVLMLFPGEASEEPGLGPSVLCAVLIALAVLVLTLRDSVRRSAKMDDGPRPLLVLVGTAVATALMLLLAFRSFPREVFARTAGSPDTWTPSAALGGQWTAVSVVALGCLVLLVAVHRSPREPRWRALLGFTAGVLAVVLVWQAAVSEVAHQPVEHTVAVDGPAPDVPRGAARLGWTWETPEWAEIEEVAAGPRGPVVLLGDGLVGLDGTTGEELWVYRRPFGGYMVVGATASGDRAYLLYQRVPGDSETRRMAVVDTATGEVTADTPVPTYPDKGPEFVDVLPGVGFYWRSVEDGPSELFARDLAEEGSGKELWAFSPDDPGRTCQYDPRQSLLPYGDTVLVGYLCLDDEEFAAELPGWRVGLSGFESLDEMDTMTGVVLALDAHTGDEEWRLERPYSRSPGNARIFPAGTAVSEGERLVVGVGSDRFGAAPVLVDPRTGEVAGSFPDPLLHDDGDPGLDYDGRVHADTGGAVHIAWAEDGNRLAHRVDPSGGIIDTTVIRDQEFWLEDFRNAVVVGDTLLVPQAKLDGENQVVDTSDPVLAVPLGEEPDAAGRLDLGMEAPIRPQDLPDLRLAAVPGGVVLYEVEGDALHGLVP